MNKKTENILGFLLLIVTLFVGRTYLASEMLFFRLVIGLSLGYVLSRAYTGFAGSVNRAYNTGSTKLMKALMLMFVLTSILVAGLVFANPEIVNKLWINPISWGLIIGGILFGFGMAFSSCCASGVLTDLITGLPRALITLIFFSFGVFIGFPLASTDLATKSFITTSTGEAVGRNGVYLPDLFVNYRILGGLNGYLGAIFLTVILALIVVALSNLYEAKRKANGSYTGHFMENIQANLKEEKIEKNYKVFNDTTYNFLFVKPWTLKAGAVGLAIIFAVMMAVTGQAWGASTPYGMWFGRVLVHLGVSVESIAEFTKQSVDFYSTSFFNHPVSVQNFGILLGTAIYLLTAGKFKNTFTSELSITFKDALLFALGGLTMGVGTRLSSGCNVGALYSPIASFSLSGWVFLVVMVIGGILGNTFAKKVNK